MAVHMHDHAYLGSLNSKCQERDHLNRSDCSLAQSFTLEIENSLASHQQIKTDSIMRWIANINGKK